MFTTLLVLLGLVFAVYATIWVLVIKGYHQQRNHMYQAFLKAWDDNSYDTEIYTDWSSGSSQLMVEFRDGLGRCYGFTIDKDGDLARDFHQRSSPASVRKVKSQALKNRFRPYTEQILTMAKLEGKFVHDDNDDMSVTSI